MNNYELVKDVMSKVGSPCWYGTYGDVATRELWKRGVDRYTGFYTDRDKLERDLGKRVYGGLGVINEPIVKFVTNNYIFKSAEIKGTIDNIPEIVGLGVWHNNGFGVYLGNDEIIDCTNNDVISRRKLSESDFTHWYYIRFIDYVETSENANESVTEHTEVEQDNVTMHIVEKGDTLKSISVKYFGDETHINQIKEINNLSSTRLKVGKVLYI